MPDIKNIADKADFIVNGYAFTREGDNIRVLNLNCPDKAIVFGTDGEVLETTMDDIEIGKRDKFYSAGIFVVPEVNDLHISKYNALAVNYAKIDRNCLGVITDGYDFIVFKEQHNIGYVEENKMDYTHFVGTLVSYLRFVL